MNLIIVCIINEAYKHNSVFSWPCNTYRRSITLMCSITHSAKYCDAFNNNRTQATQYMLYVVKQTEVSCTLIACSPCRHRQDKTVLSCLCRRCEHNCRQNKTALSCLDPVSMSFVSFQFATVQSQIHWGLLKTWKLETGSRRDKTVLLCLQLSVASIFGDLKLSIFTMQLYAKCTICYSCLSVLLSVCLCLSITLKYCDETAEMSSFYFTTQ